MITGRSGSWRAPPIVAICRPTMGRLGWRRSRLTQGSQTPRSRSALVALTIGDGRRSIDEMGFTAVRACSVVPTPGELVG